ncbi:unannotated protein [freshwater metagenome]|uniref:Unannotated protein n=1 Tax=freshwater metagenome TaxID=449393 RepID=A0A6J6Z9H0_9ZZZZ
MLGVEFLEEAEHRACEFPVRRVDGVQLDRNVEVDPLLLESAPLVVVADDRHRHDAVRVERCCVADSVKDAFVDPTDQHHHGVGFASHLVAGLNSNHGPAAGVVLADRPEAEDHDRDEGSRDPCSFGELGHHDDDGNEPGGQCPDDVDRHTRPPATLPQGEVVPDHSRLAQREAGEYPECIERDELGDITLEDDDQRRCHSSEEDDAV